MPKSRGGGSKSGGGGGKSSEKSVGDKTPASVPILHSQSDPSRLNATVSKWLEFVHLLGAKGAGLTHPNGVDCLLTLKHQEAKLRPIEESDYADLPPELKTQAMLKAKEYALKERNDKRKELEVDRQKLFDFMLGKLSSDLLSRVKANLGKDKLFSRDPLELLGAIRRSAHFVSKPGDAQRNYAKAHSSFMKIEQNLNEPDTAFRDRFLAGYHTQKELAEQIAVEQMINLDDSDVESLVDSKATTELDGEISVKGYDQPERCPCIPHIRRSATHSEPLLALLFVERLNKTVHAKFLEDYQKGHIDYPVPLTLESMVSVVTAYKATIVDSEGKVRIGNADALRPLMLAAIKRNAQVKQASQQKQREESTKAKITEAVKALVAQPTTGILGGDKCEICQRDHKTDVCTAKISQQASKIAGGGPAKS